MKTCERPVERYEIHNANLRVQENTLRYWQGLGLPTYLFAVVQVVSDGGKEHLDCYYKRFTAILTADTIRKEYPYQTDFYKVNKGDTFLAFVDSGAFGFARDLFIDHIRLCYYKGMITYPDPGLLGLMSRGASKPATDGRFKTSQ